MNLWERLIKTLLEYKQPISVEDLSNLLECKKNSLDQYVCTLNKCGFVHVAKESGQPEWIARNLYSPNFSNCEMVPRYSECKRIASRNGRVKHRKGGAGNLVQGVNSDAPACDNFVDWRMNLIEGLHLSLGWTLDILRENVKSKEIKEASSSLIETLRKEIQLVKIKNDILEKESLELKKLRNENDVLRVKNGDLEGQLSESDAKLREKIDEVDYYRRQYNPAFLPKRFK